MSSFADTPAALPFPALGPPPRPRMPVPERWTLANGLRVMAIPHSGLPQVVLRILLPAGAAADPLGFAGTASLVGALLTEGTRMRSAEALNKAIDQLGASIEVDVGQDFAAADCVLLSETLPEMLPLLAEVLTAPLFPRTELERVRAETLDALAARQDEPAQVADDRTAREIFGAHHPYGRSVLGVPGQIRNIEPEALQSFHFRHYRPEGSVLLAAGDFDPMSFRKELETAFAGWEGTATQLQYPSLSPSPPAAGKQVRVPWQDAAQAEVRIAGRGLPRASQDWIPAAVANYILGGSTITGRLGANLREEKGWTYGARSGFGAAVQPGGWVADTAVDIEVAEAAVHEMLMEIRRLADEPVAKKELQRAKDALILSLPRAFETPGRILGRWGTQVAFGLSEDYWMRFAQRVDELSAAEVLRVARLQFNPDRLIRVVVG